MSKPVNLIRTPARNGLALELEMSQREDRFVTRLRLLDNQQLGPDLLRSAEGDSQQLWPPSAPLQEVIPQENDEVGRYLAGIGRAGQSTWSVIAATCEDESGRPGFEFDFACRIKTAPAWLGSTFEMPSEGAWQQDAEIAIPDNGAHLLAVAVVDDSIATVDGRLIRIAAQLDESGGLPRTVRWKYRLLMQPK